MMPLASTHITVSVFGFTILGIVWLALYGLPFWIAWAQHLPRLKYIGFLTIFFGWWAFIAVVRSARMAREAEVAAQPPLGYRARY